MTIQTYNISINADSIGEKTATFELEDEFGRKVTLNIPVTVIESE